MWGPHPDPEVDTAERTLWAPGDEFLRGLLSAALGVGVPRTLQKAGPAPEALPDFGALAKLLQSQAQGAAPAVQLDAWTGVIDRLVSGLLPQHSAMQVAQAWSLRSFLVARAEKLVSGTVADTWASMWPSLAASEQEQLEWTRLHAGEHLTNLKGSAREALVDELFRARKEGTPLSKLQTRLFDRFSGLGRDWRRIALTETAMAVQDGRLVSALATGAAQVAVWRSAPTACPFCKKMNGRRFKVLAKPDPAQGDSAVWPGKSNVGRAAALFTKDGTKRTPDELWWPACPAHPNCACQLQVLPAAVAAKLKV